MKEEKTQGIDTETTTKDGLTTTKTTSKTELLDLRAGYNQHTSPLQPHTARILNVLIQMKNDNKGNWETGENIRLGDNFIKLWQKVSNVQLTHVVDFLNERKKYVLYVDVLEELTKTL